MITHCLRTVLFITCTILLCTFPAFATNKTGKKNPAGKKKIISNSKSPKNTIHIIIDKTDATLKVYNDNQLRKLYPVVFGSDDLGDKMCEGDKRTPEGTFKIKAKRLDVKWVAVFTLDYPTKESYKKFNEYKLKELIPADARIGGAIAIHGTEPEKDNAIDYSQNWTNGCVALKSAHALELYNYIPVGTPVTILKSNLPKKIFEDVATGIIHKPDTTETKEDKISRAVREAFAPKKPEKKPFRDKYVIGDSTMTPPDVKQQPVVRPETYFTALEKARKYNEEYDLQNALEYYTMASKLNVYAALSDTIALIKQDLRFSTALHLATQLQDKASHSFIIKDTVSFDGKIAVCNRSIELYKDAIVAFQDAHEIDTTKTSPHELIKDCSKAIEQIISRRLKFETDQLYGLYIIAKANAIKAKDEKDTVMALKYYEEALGYLLDERLKTIGGYKEHLDYISSMVNNTRRQLSEKK